VNLIKTKRKTLLKLEGKQSEEAQRPSSPQHDGISPEREILKRDNQLRLPVETLGIALAMIAQLLGIEIELILPEDSTKERTFHACLWGDGHIDARKGRNPGPRETMPKKVAEGGYDAEPICQ
jgi:cysteine synthase B